MKHPCCPPIRSYSSQNSRKLSLLLTLGLITCLKLFAELKQYWVSHSGTPGGTGASQGSPALFDPVAINNRIGTTTDDNATHDWEIYFLPSSQPYLFEQLGVGISQGTGANARTVKIKSILGQNGQRPVLMLGSIQQVVGYHQNFNIKSVEHTLIATLGKHFGTRHYLKHVEIENLVLDGDFDGQGAFTGSGSIAGYKSFALEIYARTGLVKNVLVRRFGSNGIIPWTYYDSAGTETFPVSVWTKASDKVAGDWDLPVHKYPWVIENVEVAEFHSVHGGYATLIMPHVENTGANPASWSEEPIIAVRRCQIRGNASTIALGTAAKSPNKSQRLLFEDNVVLNSLVTLNTDTGAIGWLTFRHNVLLDIVDGMYLGRWGEGVDSYPAAMTTIDSRKTCFVFVAE